MDIGVKGLAYEPVVYCVIYNCLLYVRQGTV